MSATKQLTKLVLLTVAFLVGVAAYAQPTIDSVNVQGYMKTATGTAVTNGTYNIAYAVIQGGTAIWGREYSTVVTDGLFSKTLSGGGGDLSAGTYSHCTGMNSNFTAATLDSATLNSGSAGATVIRVCSRSTINGVQVLFDVTVAAAPTALVADVANSVADGALAVAAFASSAYTDTSAGAADAGKLVALDAGGLIDSSMLPPTMDQAGAIVIGGGSTTSVTIGSGSGTVTVGGASNTGVTVGSGSGTVTVGGAGNTQIDVGGTGATTLNLGAAATGALTTIVGGNAGASATTVQSGTGGTTVTSTGTTATAVNITATGVGGGITLSPEATGFAIVNNAQIRPLVFSTTTSSTTSLTPGGAEVIMITNQTNPASTIATIVGCNAGTYAQGQKITIHSTGWTSGNLVFTDTAVATATADSMALSAGANFTMTSSAATRGSSLTLMCTTVGVTKKWVEVGRSANTN